MKKLSIILLITATSASAQLFKCAGGFEGWKEFYKARQQSTRNNQWDCKQSAMYLWNLLGEKNAELVIIKLRDNYDSYHAVVFAKKSKLFMDPTHDKVSKRLPLGAKIIDRISSFSEVPVSYRFN